MKAHSLSMLGFLISCTVLGQNNEWSYGIVVAGGLNGWFTNDDYSYDLAMENTMYGHRMGLAYKVGMSFETIVSKKSSVTFEPSIVQGRNRYVIIYEGYLDPAGIPFSRKETIDNTINSIHFPIYITYFLKKSIKGLCFDYGFNPIINRNGTERYYSHYVALETTEIEKVDNLNFNHKGNRTVNFAIPILFGLGLRTNSWKVGLQAILLPGQEFDNKDSRICNNLCEMAPVFFNNYLFLNLKYFLTKKEISK